MKQISLFIHLTVATTMEELIKKIAQLSNRLILICLFVNGAVAETPPENIRAKQYSPNAGTSYPINVYWGDTHLHTNLSVDANFYGNKILTPDDAYRFAKGEPVIAHNGEAVRLSKPLDFLVIADHANNMGVMTALVAKDPLLLATDIGKQWQKKLQELQGANMERIEKFITDRFFGAFSDAGSVRNTAFRQSVWDTVIKKAEQYNTPGQFTAFIGYEWTPLELDKWADTYGKTLHHRVVLFEGGKNEVSQILPFSRYDSEDPAELWTFLANYHKKTGGEVIAIPHNSNTSRGQMFAPLDAKGNPLSKDYAQRRSYWEPLVEVTQIKGDSETHPLISPTDEFADYETWEFPLKNGQDEETGRQYEYVRSALKLGLAHQVKLGVNPFKFGMIGSTDAHTALATASENNFWGKQSIHEPLEGRSRIWSLPKIKGGFSAAGYAAVWAEENTRESLFAAMKRKEVYASTGPRMTVRFFGGWEYESNHAQSPDLAKIGYSKGVPMGGDLANAPKGKAPSFLIRAVKDPDGANLDRVQVIKGWHDKKGELHEKVYNIALSDRRKENWRGKVKPVGSTIDVKNASYTNSIGDPELAVVWNDPDFDKDELAFYYVRVLEIPTPRWTAYDAKFFDLKDTPKEVPMVTQERAYTSPIWYSPPAQAGGE